MNRKQYEEGIRALVVYHPGTLGPAYEAMIEAYVIELEKDNAELAKEVAKLRRELQKQLSEQGEMN